jgi:hypothetical protein
MIEIHRCKYLLPCGYCDKYDIPCKATDEDVSKHHALPIDNATECNHEWRFECSLCSIVDGVEYAEIYRCPKCGMTKHTLKT